MPKVQAIISQLERNCPPVLPEVTQVFQSDPERIQEALKERGKGQEYYVNLRILLYKTLKMLRPKEKSEFLKPLLEIAPNDLTGDIRKEGLLHICEGIVEAEDQFRTNTVDKFISDLSKMTLNNAQNARLQIISAGNNFLKGDFIKASMQYLTASRMEAFVQDQRRKIELAEKAIAFAFICPLGPETHKVICSLCMNQITKKSKLFQLVSKLYREDIITKEDVSAVSDHLPANLRQPDVDGVSILQQAAFSRNMIPIINSFSSIRLPTLLRLSGVPGEDKLMVLLEKTYKAGEVIIDQVAGVVRIKSQTDPSDVVKEFLTQIDAVLKNPE